METFHLISSLDFCTELGKQSGQDMEQGSVAQGFRGALLRRCWRPGGAALVLLLSGRAPQAPDPVQSGDKQRGPVPPAGEGCLARTSALLLLLVVLSPGVFSASLQNIQRSQETGTVTGGPADLAWGKAAALQL